jgi:hypothetical protein
LCEHQSSTDSGYAGSYNKDIRPAFYLFDFQGLMMNDTTGCCAYDCLGRASSLVPVLNDPGTLFSDIGNLEEKRVQAGAFQHLFEGIFMFFGRTGSYYYSGQVMSFDVVLKKRFPLFRAQEPVWFCKNDTLYTPDELQNSIKVHGVLYVRTTFTQVNANSFCHQNDPRLIENLFTRLRPYNLIKG